MDRFESLRLFTRVVELGSFSQAAAALDIPRATATHAIKALEARLGARLLERTTRHVRTTADGQAFYERSLRVLAELESAESSLQQVATNPQGVLRVDMHGAHATRIVLPRIDEFHAAYPDIELLVSSGDRLVDLVREGVDCVIRAGRPRDSSLVARRLANMPQIVCASPEYLAEHGKLRRIDDLETHQIIRFIEGNGALDPALEFQVDGKAKRVNLKGWMAVADAQNYVVSALRGCGLIQLPRFHVEDELARGELVQVLPKVASPDMPVSVLYPSQRQLSPRVRVFIDWLRELYAQRFPAN